MIILVTILHVIVCLFLIIVVLLQSGKAADLAGAFGGMGSQTAFGPRGAATVLSKATTIAAALFMVTSLSLSVMYTRAGRTSGGGGSVLERAAPATQQKQQSTPLPEQQKQQQAPGVPFTVESGGQKQVAPVTPPAPAPAASKQETAPPKK